MREFPYLIIGGGIAGTTAAETIRQRDPAAGIAIVSDEPHRLYSRIMLSKPNFFLERIPFDRIWLKPESWYAEQRISFFGGRRVIGLDLAAKEVRLDGGAHIRYGKLLLAVGACARPWSVPGSGTGNVFSLRTLDDARAIIAAMKSAKRAVAVGGGFISFEMCDMLRLAGVAVVLILRESYYWEPLLDEASGRMIELALERGGVKIVRGAEVGEVIGDGRVTGVRLQTGEVIGCDMIIAGVGVVCPLGWIQAAGIAANRGVIADEYLRASVPDVWTAGDTAEFQDAILGERVQLGNWANAQTQGRIAGRNMAGGQEPFRAVSFYTTQGFGITIAFVGDVRSGSDRVVISRGSAAHGSYGRLILKDGELIGATLMNRTQELSPISKIIERNIKVGGREGDLADASFDLGTLLHE